MADYPDWTRLFQLAGTEITIPINIESSDIVLSVSIDAVTADLDVNITASEVTIDINFTDQSVAVFDANQWFALQATQVGVQGAADVGDGSTGYPATRTVPSEKTFFITGIGGLVRANIDSTILLQLVIADSWVVAIGAQRGTGIAFDTPMRATTGQLVKVAVSQFSGASQTCDASMWGYDKPD